MSKGEQILAELKFDKEINVTNASKWSDEDLCEMMNTYLKAKMVAKETKNNSLYLIVSEKISQLESAIELKNKKRDQSKVPASEVSL